MSKSLTDIAITAEEGALVDDAINFFGDGDHPVSDAKTRPFFVAEYVVECLRKMRDKADMTEHGKVVIASLLMKLQ